MWVGRGSLKGWGSVCVCVCMASQLGKFGKTLFHHRETMFYHGKTMFHQGKT